MCYAFQLLKNAGKKKDVTFLWVCWETSLQTLLSFHFFAFSFIYHCFFCLISADVDTYRCVPKQDKQDDAQYESDSFFFSLFFLCHQSSF